MGYKLRCDINKTTIYSLCKQFLIGYQMPSLRNCKFEKYRGSYWLDFVVNESDEFYLRMRVSFSTFGRNAALQFDVYNPFDDKPRRRVQFETIPFQFLLEHGYVREVA